MMIESFNTEEDEEANESDPTRGWSLIGLSIATSMDALGVGFGMGIAKMTLFIPAVIIGITAGIMTYAGICLGKKLSAKLGKRVETFGAIILYIIAFKLLSI
jgi:putative Mn2+ efflux pump MntP